MEFKIYLNNIRLHAYIGCLREESIIGTDFIINIEITTNNVSYESDSLNATVDYCYVYQIIKEESQYRYNLIETLAHKIMSRIKNIDLVHSCKVEVKKLNPPINGDVEYVSVIFAS